MTSADPAIRFLSGNPTPEEIAAVTVALAVAMAPQPSQQQARSRWVAAARRENLGEGIIASPGDLAAL